MSDLISKKLLCGKYVLSKYKVQVFLIQRKNDAFSLRLKPKQFQERQVIPPAELAQNAAFITAIA